MSLGFFVTGTDTGVGKSLVSAALVHALNAKGVRTVGMKPVATGCVETEAGLRSEDAELVMQYAAEQLDYQWVNPYAFKHATAPHIAAKIASQPIEFEKIQTCYDKLAAQVECVVVEGIGGWKVPLSEESCVADLAKALNLPVIVVVAVRLGCLNHAILTYESILKGGIPLAGWVANIMDVNVEYVPELLGSLRSALYGPMLAIIPPMREVSPQTIST